MASLVTVERLARWCREEIDPADPLALDILDVASRLVSRVAEHPEWLDPESDDYVEAPFDAVTVCLLVAKRTWQNPDMVVREGAIGPIGGDAYLDEQAYGMRLTEAEIATLEGLQGSPESPKGNGLWVQPMAEELTSAGVIFLPDNSGSDWFIPYLDPDSDDAMNPDV